MRKIITLFALIVCLSIHAAEPDKLDWKLGGRLLLDGLFYADSPDTLSNQVNIVDIRLCGKVTFGDSWYVKLDMGFTDNKVSPKDAFLQYTKKNNRFRVGYMFGFFSLDQSSSTNDLVFNTLSNVADAFYPGRRIGISYTRSPKKIYLSVGAFVGDNINLKTTVRQGYNFSGRIAWRPVCDDENLLHLGTGIYYRVPDSDKETGMKTITLKAAGVTYLPSPKYQMLVIDNARNQIQTNIECYLFKQKWMFQSEYMMTRISRTGQTRLYTAQGGYAQSAYLIRGNHFGYDATDAIPVMPTDPHSLMIILRYSIDSLNDREANLYGGGQQDFSAGINYYYNQYLSTRLNYSYVCLDRHSPIEKNNISLIQARIQVRF